MSAVEAVTLLAATILVLVSGVWAAPRLTPGPDECWELLVARRVAAGRRLYRDVFFGAGPLSVWITRAAVAVAGERLVVLRRLAVVVTVITGGVLVAWCLRLGVPWQAATATVTGGALLSSALWRHDNLYGLLGRLGAALAMSGPLLGSDAAGALDVFWWVVGGAGLAAALLSKYTLGIAALPALVGGAAASAYTVTATVVVIGSGVLLAGVGYAVVAARSGPRSVIARLVVNKTSLVDTGRAGFFAAWRTTLGAPPEGGIGEWRVSAAAFALTTLSVLLAGAGVVAAIGGSGDHGAGAAVAGLVVVAAAGLWPRADDAHVRNTLLLWLAPALVGAHLLAPWVTAGLAGMTLLAGLASLVLAAVDRSRVVLPAAQGSAVDGIGPVVWEPARLRAAADELRRHAGGTVFLLRPDAAAWYLLTDLRNPTAYDYPLASTFGPHGQAHVVARLATGDIGFCCFIEAHAGALTPLELELYVGGLPVVAHTAAGTLVTAR